MFHAVYASGMETYYRQQKLKRTERQKVDLIIDAHDKFAPEAQFEYRTLVEIFNDRNWKWLTELLPNQLGAC